MNPKTTLVTPLLLLSATLCLAQAPAKPDPAPPMPQMAESHLMLTPAQLKWGPPPPGLPAGAQVAVLSGDPAKAGEAFTMRAQFPAGYKVPPHWHPGDEYATVLKGTLLIGMSDTFNPDAAQALAVGSYVKMPKEVRHFAMAKVPTTIQIHGIGPFGITYVNPADDPRTPVTKK